MLRRPAAVIMEEGENNRLERAMSITLNLPPEIEQLLRVRAAQQGQTIEAYLEQLADREARANGTASSTTDASPSDASEFEQRLNELGEGLPPLPPTQGFFPRRHLR